MRFTPIVKVVDMDCNLRCKYCFYEEPERRNSGNLFSLDLLRKLFSQLPEVNENQENIRVIWHGGEPTLAGLPYFRKAMEIQERVEEQTGSTFLNSIQTNGVLVDKSWVEFFEENDFRVGISLDGPPEIHDRYRRTCNVCGSYDKTMRGLNLCLDANVPLGCLATINEAHGSAGRNLFDFFTGLGVTNFRVNPCYEVDVETGEPLPFSTSPEVYGSLLVELFDAWIEMDDPSINCGPVDDFLRGVLGQRKRQCVFKRSCHFFGIWTDGLVYPCETRGNLEVCIGNLKVDNLSQIANVWESKSRALGVHVLREECKRCSWYKACRGGCARYDVFRGARSNLFCSSRKAVYSHIAEYMEGGEVSG